MNDLCDITIQRLKIELGRLKEKVQENSKAMHNMHAAKGILRSGATIAAEIEIGRNAFKSFRDICIQNLQVMSDEAVFLTGVSISRITTSISEMYTELHGSIFENMTKSCEHSSKPELRERYMPEIENEMNNTLSEIKLFIDERIISKGNQGAITMLKLFVSHCSKDVEIVEPLVDLIRSALNLNAGDIRCTSIDGYRLPGGADTDDQLRGEVHDSEAFIGVISSNSIDSMYVVFELGARWGVKKHLLPLLAPGTSAAVLAGPLKGLNALRLDSAAQIHQFVNDLGKVLQITPELAATYQKHVDAILRVRQGPVLMTGEIKEERPETADEEETMGDGPGSRSFQGSD